MEVQESGLIFDPTKISGGVEPEESGGATAEPESEKLNLFKDELFDDNKDKSEETDKDKVLEDKDTPDPDDIKDDKSEEKTVFSVVLGQELMDGGVLSSFDEETIAKIEAEEGRGAAMKAMFEIQAKATDAELKASYDSEYQEYLNMRSGGVSPEEATQVQQLKNFTKEINEIDLKGEDETSVQARKNVLILDYRLNTKYSEEQIQKRVNKAYDEGSDLEDIDEAKERVDAYVAEEEQRVIDDAAAKDQARVDAQQKQTNDLTSFVDKTEEYFKGEQVTDQVKANMKKLLTTPVKLANGSVTSELWAERDKDPVKFDSGIAYLKAIGYFDGKPLDKFIKNAKTKATSDLDLMLSDNSNRSFMRSSNKSFNSGSAEKKNFLDY